MKATDIKPCPFCGSTDIEICQTNPQAIWFRCDCCQAETTSADHVDDALAFWNQRSSSGSDGKGEGTVTA